MDEKPALFCKPAALRVAAAFRLFRERRWPPRVPRSLNLNTQFEDYWYDDEIPAALVGDFPVRSALLMEAESGRILFQKDENKPVPIASVTKVMVTLLIMEATDSGRVSMDEEVTVSERAGVDGRLAGLSGAGREDERLRTAQMSGRSWSANDASVALAEHIYGARTASFWR